MLKIGLPAGAEFALMAVYLFIVYTVSRPFGSAAQAGFGIGLRIVQACFLPIVALGIAVAPVAGQNFGARPGAAGSRHLPLRRADGGASTWSDGHGAVSRPRPAPIIAVFSGDPQVIAVGERVPADRGVELRGVGR